MTVGDDDEADGVGFGRPPKSGQFQKGQSGNPRGRPRKKDASPELIPARFPTRQLMRNEAARKITVKDASGTHDLTTTEGIFRAQYISGLRGSVFAQREILRRAEIEDERYHRECKERFDLWFDYQERCRAAIEAATKAGRDAPDFLPHPDDISLDWERLEVRFLGAIDEEGRAREVFLGVAQALAYEMAIYLGEDNCLPDKNGTGGRIGPYMGFYLVALACLPPRLRLPIEAYESHIYARAALGRKAWGEELERRCRAAGMPFIRLRRGVQLPTLSFERLGLKWGAVAARLKVKSRPSKR